MKANFWVALTILAAVVVSAETVQGAHVPNSFSKTLSPSWSTIEIRSDVDAKRSWDTVFDILAKNFEIDAVFREDGYIRTGWIYTWSGEYLAEYRVRVTVKFSPDRTRLQFLPEAQYLDGSKWIMGTDNRLVSTVQTDLMGTVGRTAR